MDLFDLFGVETQVQEVEKKSSKKGAKKDAAGKKGAKKSNSQKTEDTYALPITIYTGYREPFVIEKNDSEDALTLAQLKERLQEKYPEYQVAYTSMIVKKTEKAARAGFNLEKGVAKGTVDLTKDTRLTLAGYDFDLTQCMSDEKCAVSIEDMQVALKKVHPGLQHMGIVKNGDQMAPVFADKVLTTEELAFPIRLSLFGRENWMIEETAYKAFLVEKGYAKEEDSVKYDNNILKEMVIERYPDFKGFLELQYLQDDNIVLVTMHVKEKTVSCAKKMEMYPTEDVTLSFIFNRVELTPDLFGGKKEVSKKELINYIATLYPEYDEKNTNIRYDKERKLLIPTIQGSTKG